MYFITKSYFNPNIQRLITITPTEKKNEVDTKLNKPKSRKKGKLTRTKKAKNKYNFSQLKKQLGNDMVIKLLLRLVEGKAGSRPVGRPPQQQPSLKQPRPMKLARGSGIPGREKPKLEKKKQGETEEEFFKRVEDYVSSNNPSYLYFSQLLQQDRQRAEALIREQIASIRNQPVVVQQAVERQAEVDKDFIRELVKRLRTAEGASSVDRQKIVREGLKEYTQNTGDRLVSSDEEYFYDLARTRGKKNRQEAESRIGQRFYGAGTPRRKARTRVVAEETTTTLGELGGEALSSAESSLISGFTSGETSAGEALSRFQQSGSFRRQPDNPYDRGSVGGESSGAESFPLSPDEEAERLRRAVRKPKQQKSKRYAKAKEEAKQEAKEEAISGGETSESGLSYQAESFTTQESSAGSSGLNPLSPETFKQKVKELERERRFTPFQQADTGEIEPTATEPTGKVGSKAVARSGRTPTPKGIQQKQKSLVDAGLSALTNEGNRVGQQLTQSLLGVATGATKKVKGVVSQAQTFSQFADEARQYELEHGVFGRRGLLPDRPLTAEEHKQSGEFQELMWRRASGDVGEGEFSSEGEQAGKTYETEGSGAEEFEDYFGAERETQPQATIFDPQALKSFAELTGEPEPAPAPIEVESEVESGVESGFTTDVSTEYSEEERDLDFSKLQKMKPKLQKKAFGRLQKQLKKSDYELELTQADIAAFKGNLDEEEQLVSQLSSLPYKIKIAERSGLLGEKERLEQELEVVRQKYSSLERKSGNETDDSLSELSKELYLGPKKVLEIDRLDELGEKVNKDNWNSYESMVLEKYVREGKLTDEERNAIQSTNHSKKREIMKRLEKGSRIRKEWLFRTKNANSWWDNYFKQAKKEIDPEEQQVGRPKQDFTERGQAFLTRYDKIIDNYKSFDEDKQDLVRSVLLEQKSDKIYKDLASGKTATKQNQERFFKNIEKKIAQKVSQYQQQKSKTYKKEELEDFSFEDFSLSVKSGTISEEELEKYLKLDKTTGKLKYFGEDSVIIEGPMPKGQKFDIGSANNWEVISPDGRFTITRHPSFPLKFKITKVE
jgi:hypothetical protein